MPVLNKDNNEEVKEYNEFVRTKVGASFMQDLNWGLVKNTWKQEAVYLKKNNKIVAAMMILIQPVPYTNVTVAYAPRGPVCDINDIDLINELIAEADPIIKKHKCYVLKFDPQVVYSDKLDKIFRDNGYKTSGSKISKTEVIQPIYEAILNIENVNQDDLIDFLPSKVRYNTRLAFKKGVKVRYSRDKEDLKIFYDIYKITAERNQIGYRNYDYFERMLEAYDEDHLRIYVAEHEGDKLSAAIITSYGGELYYVYSASSNEKRNLKPVYAMHYEMMKWAIEKKCSKYNFGGIFNLDSNDGLYQFKVGFCGEEGIYRHIGEINKVYKPFMYFLISRILPLVKKIKTKKRH